MRLSLGVMQGQGQNQSQFVGLPSAAALSMVSLSAEQIEELAREAVELALSGTLDDACKEFDGKKRNFMDTGSFRELTSQITHNSPVQTPEFHIASDLQIQDELSARRDRIITCLSQLKREEPTAAPNIFSKRFLDEYDWIVENRRKLVHFTLEKQESFVQEPMNPMLLKKLSQQDLAEEINYSNTTVSRLIRDMQIEFPDTSVREFALLVPGASITTLQGRYAIRTLMNDPSLYDRNVSHSRPWLINDKELVALLKERFDIEVRERVIRKYKAWVRDNLPMPPRTTNQ